MPLDSEVRLGKAAEQRDDRAVNARDRIKLSVVLFVWLVMLTAALVLTARYGRNVPIWDDWDLVPTATGHQPVTAQWLWSQHNEHRVPIPRLLLLAMLRLSGIDFRAGMYFNVAATAALALGMILTARRLRGRVNVFDAFFPLALMNWGQAVNFLWCWQVQFYSSMFFAGAVLIVIAQYDMPPKLFLTVAAGSCVLLLILSGANGLALVPPLVLWLLYIAAVNWQLNTVTSKRCALVLMAFAVVAVALVGLYFVGYNRVPYHPSTHRPRIVVRTAAQFLTMGFGPGVVGLGFDHRTPMFFWPFVCALIVGLFLVTGGLLLVTRWKHPDQRPQATGFFLFLGAMASLALAIGLGRDGFEPRYITLSLPGICAVYLVWIKYGQRLKNIVPAMLMVVVLVVFVPDTLWGWRYAVDLNSRLSSFERDIKTGMPPYQLICNYSSLHPHHEIMMDYMPMLRDAHAGAFSNLRDNPPFREVSLPLTPVDTYHISWDNGVARQTGEPAWITFALPEDVQAGEIRLTYTYSNPKGTEPYIGIYWKSKDELDFGERSYTKYSPTGDRANWRQGSWSRLNNGRTILQIAVCHPVTTVCIKPAIEQGTIVIHDLTILVPTQDNVPE